MSLLTIFFFFFLNCGLFHDQLSSDIVSLLCTHMKCFHWLCCVFNRNSLVTSLCVHLMGSYSVCRFWWHLSVHISWAVIQFIDSGYILLCASYGQSFSSYILVTSFCAHLMGSRSVHRFWLHLSVCISQAVIQSVDSGYIFLSVSHGQLLGAWQRQQVLLQWGRAEDSVPSGGHAVWLRQCEVRPPPPPGSQCLLLQLPPGRQVNAGVCCFHPTHTCMDAHTHTP